MNNDIKHPTDELRRSPLYRYHELNNASYVARAGGLVVESYLHENESTRSANSLALVDLSCLNRVGFKGTDTPSWLEEQALQLPEQPNQAILDNEGVLVARLSDNEFIALDATAEDGLKIDSLRNNWSMDIGKRSYLLERADTHAWFAMTGEFASQVLSKVCAVDMRPHKFDQLMVAQTSVARANSIVVRADQGSTLCFHILADLSTSEFMWEGLLDAMQEFNGEAVGLTAFQKLTAI